MRTGKETSGSGPTRGSIDFASWRSRPSPESRDCRPTWPSRSCRHATEASWIGTADGVTRWKDGRTTIYRTRDGLPDNRVGTLFEDSTGRVLVRRWAAWPRSTTAGSSLRSVSFTRIVYNIVEQRAGEFWITDQEQGLIHLIGDGVATRIPWSALGHDDHATALVADRARRGLWLGFYNGGIAFVKDGAIQRVVRSRRRTGRRARLGVAIRRGWRAVGGDGRRPQPHQGQPHRHTHDRKWPAVRRRFIGRSPTRTARSGC